MSQQTSGIDLHNDHPRDQVLELARTANLEPQPRPSSPIQQYSVFTKGEKWIIVSIAAAAGFFSPLAANIYFPAIPAIALAFHKSTELINLTVTVNMVVQGISPLFWGPIADRSGRRLVLLMCMITLCGSCIGLALVPASAYWALMLLRCLQAAGSASTIALGAGIIADVAVPSERGGFMSIFNLGPMFGPSLGPVIGGVLAQHLGWRSIFWFLVIASVVAFVLILLLLPETLRALVGDGSIPPPQTHMALIPIIGRSRRQIVSDDERAPRRGFQNPFTLFLYPDVTLLLFLNAIAYAVLYAVTASMSTLFKETYPFLDETAIGLSFLAVGGGMLIATLINGRLLDREYRRVRDKMIRNLKTAAGEKSTSLKAEDVTKEENFPIEYVRLRVIPLYLCIFVCSVTPYGWVLHQRVSLAVPLILHLFVGFTMFSVMNTSQTLIVDLVPGRSSSVTACNNLVRCSLGAVIVSVVEIIINSIGVGWAFTLFGCISIICIPMTFLELRMGPRWRARRRERKRAKTVS